MSDAAAKTCKVMGGGAELVPPQAVKHRHRMMIESRERCRAVVMATPTSFLLILAFRRRRKARMRRGFQGAMPLDPLSLMPMGRHKVQPLRPG